MRGGATLRFDNVAKTFGGTKALKGVSFDVRAGEIVALLGENGAGKSTLIKILGGIHRADSGEIVLDRPPGRDGAKPVSFIHQDLGLVEWMTVAENVALAQGFGRGAGLGAIDWKTTARAAEAALALVGCDIDTETRVKSLSRTEKSLVAIARALATDCDFLVLDEPTASLPANEVERLFAVMRSLRERGVGMIYVSHRLDEIFRVADRVVVLRDGAVVGEGPVAEMTPEGLVRLIVGRSTFEAFLREERPSEGVRLEVRGLRTEGVGPIDFDLRRNELLGLVGLRGAGQEDIGRALFGVVPHSGTIRLDGREVRAASPVEALGQGIGLVARDRGEEAVASALSVRENIFLNPGASGRGLFSILSPRHEADRAAALGARVGLRPNAPELAIEALSGGNQQKVVVARWLASARRLLIAEDPTAGVDVGAKAEIYALIARALEDGLAVIIVSTDFEEVAQICHRALVFSRGRIVRELAGPALTTEAVITAASVSEAV
ncbi:sugar ABC transporter ATP-binding protein [Amaricoccus sp.]|uniref:sugar ABC transporter ATP-binding protein n=1 Tax=Amaricoccus sp. TaxID=1872485 RepID=UPI0026136735|nr:sugar ABC transporter ATP-binding protein [Amaricoccus sp.]HRO11414.1 sugar ABC transporter ATP-binding protein [Amaricoccus sp.]